MPAFEAIPGALDAGALIICDHAANAIPPCYGTLGLPREALERHIAYDIGAADVTRALAAELGAPAVLSTFSRLLIDPNRGLDDPTLVMRFSDGAIVPGNAPPMRRRSRAGARNSGRRIEHAIAATVEAMLATGEPPAIVSIHSFTGRPARGGATLEDRGPMGPRRADSKALIEALVGEADLLRRRGRR